MIGMRDLKNMMCIFGAAVLLAGCAPAGADPTFRDNLGCGD